MADYEHLQTESSCIEMILNEITTYLTKQKLDKYLLKTFWLSHISDGLFPALSIKHQT